MELLRSSGSEGSKGSEGSEGYGGGFAAVFSCRQAASKTPSEPARAVGGTHGSAQSARAIEPGRRRHRNPPDFGNPLILLPADRYLLANVSLTARTEILRFVETLQRVSKSAEVGPQPAHKRAFLLSADRPRMTEGGRKSGSLMSNFYHLSSNI